MTEQPQPDPTGTVISERDQRRILAAMMKMPYAASSRVPKPRTAMGETVTADAVVAFLRGLAEVLTEVSAEKDQHRPAAACSPSRPTCRRSAASSAPHPPR
jgi:hypothetical protein